MANCCRGTLAWNRRVSAMLVFRARVETCMERKMVQEPNRFAPLHFSSGDRPRDVPTCEEITEHSVSRRRVSLSQRRYRVDTRIWVLQPGAGCAAQAQLRVQRMSLSCGMSAQRTRELLADGNDDFVLQFHHSGHRAVSQRGRDAIVMPGGAILTSNADESAVLLPGHSRSVGIALSRRLMTALCPGIDDAVVRPLQPGSGVLRLLVRYLEIFEEEGALATPELRHLVGTQIYDLCALAIGAPRDAAEIASRRGLRAARLHAIKADISQHLDGDVSVAALAARQGVTPRYVHKLFEREGVTLSRFVLGQRLMRVHRRLTDPGAAGLTIGAIVYAAGFADLSTFNREFRRQFDMTPSDVRGTRSGLRREG
jgi:AraC-like DNA-binding protein